MSYRGQRKGNYGTRVRNKSSSQRKSKSRRLVSFYSGWKENPNEFRKDVRQGGIPNKVWNSPILQEYLKDPTKVFGYVGAFERTMASDKILMEEMEKAHMRVDQIARWMISSDGRHIADYLSDSKKAFREAVIKALNYYH